MSWWKRLFGQDKSAGDSAPSAENTQPEERSEAPLVAFEPHNDLERRLMQAAADAAARPGFERALLEATLYAATPAPPESHGQRTLGRGEYISLLNVQSPDGAQVVAIFTAQERIADVFGAEVGFVAMDGRELLSMVESQGAWLNPGFPYSVHWTSDQVNALLGKPVQHTVAKDTRVMLGAPANPPTALIKDLQDVLSRDGRIDEAWFALAHWPDEGKSAWFLDIRTSLAPPEVQLLLAETLTRADYAGQPLDIVVNRPGAEAGSGIRLVPVATH
jgi:hypothetical protein